MLDLFFPSVFAFPYELSAGKWTDPITLPKAANIVSRESHAVLRNKYIIEIF